MEDLEIGQEKLRRRAIASKGLIIGYVAVTALSIIIFILAQSNIYFDAYLPGGFNVTRYEMVDYVSIFIMFGSYIVVSMWIFQGHKNIHNAGFAPLEFTPGWAVGWFAVPIASIWKPFQAMRELWNASTSDYFDYETPANGLLWVWWIAWLAGGIGRFGETNLTVLIFASAGEVIAAICLWIIIVKITDGQQSLNVAEVFA